MAENERPICIVIDNGSGICKAGFSGNENPSTVFPTVVARPDDGSDAVYIGHEAQARRGSCTLSYPVHEGKVCNWEDMTRIWRSVYEKDLRVQVQDFPALITEVPLNHKENRAKMAQVCFEELDI